MGTLRAILRRHRIWAEIQQDVRMLPTRDDIGHALTEEEEKALLQECLNSRCRQLYPAVMLALNTAMRYSEVRLLQWKQVDFAGKVLTVGKSKTHRNRTSNPVKCPNSQCAGDVGYALPRPSAESLRVSIREVRRKR